MIQKGTILYPERMDSSEMFYNDEPYAYWVCVPEYNFYNWVLYKEYNDYESVSSINDCLSACSYEDVMTELRTYIFYEGLDREKLCKMFRQRSLSMSLEDMLTFEDFTERD